MIIDNGYVTNRAYLCVMHYVPMLHVHGYYSKVCCYV